MDFHDQTRLGYIDVEEPDYAAAGTPNAALMAAWVAEALVRHPGALSALAARAADDFERARAGSAREATLELLHTALHEALINGDAP